LEEASGGHLAQRPMGMLLKVQALT